MAKTRYLVRPQPRLQKLQRDIRKQFGTYKSTYLAKVNGAVRLPGGIFWTHDATGTDANGNTTYGAPRKLLMLPGAAIFPRPNTKVDVVTIHGVDYIARTNSHELERMGVDPHQSNTLDPVVQYKALDFIINLQAFKTPGASSTHIIGSIYKKPDGTYDVLPTTGGYDFVTANIPSTDTQVVVCQWVNTDDNTVSATVSSEVSRDIDLKHADNLSTVLTLINECVDTAPANHIGVNAWRIYDDSTIATLDDNNKLADLRGIIGGGGGSFTVGGDSGTPQTVSTGDTLTISGGVGLASVASATDTITLNLDVNSLTADASPDGAADYVATWDASAGTHKKVLLDDLPGGGGGFTSFTVAGDSGSSQTISDGNTLTIAGGAGLASTASATDTLTLDLDVNSLTTDSTPDGAADYIATWDASASAHKKVLLNTLVGAASSATSVGAYASSRPSTPATGSLYIVTDGYWNQEVYDGSAWRPMKDGALLTTPSSSGWSWDNQGSATIDSTLGGLYLYVPSGTSSLSLRCRYRTAPSTPYTITAYFEPNILGSTNGYFGFGFRQSSDGKLACALYEATPATATPTLYSAKFTSATTFSANYTNIKRHEWGHWLRIADNGTNRILSVSSDGRNWLNFHSVSRTDFLTADQVFFGVAPSSTTLEGAITLLSWKEA